MTIEKNIISMVIFFAYDLFKDKEFYCFMICFCANMQMYAEVL